MSYVALVTNRFDEVTRFFGDLLGFPTDKQWDRSNARGRRFDAGGMRLEIIDKLGIDPYRGTVNLIVLDAEFRSVWDRLKDSPGVRIYNPNRGQQDCNARCYRVSIGDQVSGAIVLPEVADYAADQVEIIAAMGIRDALDIDDGDSLILKIP